MHDRYYPETEEDPDEAQEAAKPNAIQYNTTIRSAGLVKRYHTQPMIQTQTVAEHTWQVLRIWLELFGKPSTDVTVAILLHDVGEGKTGDLPFYIKRERPDLKKTLSDIEHEHVKDLIKNCCHVNINTETLRITEHEKLLIKVCDLLEMAEFSIDEQNLGNYSAISIFYNVNKKLEEIIPELHEWAVQRIHDRLEHLAS